MSTKINWIRSIVGLDGVRLTSSDKGFTFTSSVRADQLANTSIVTDGPGEGLSFNTMGVGSFDK